MKPWIRKTLMGSFGIAIALGGLTACSSGHHHRGGWSPEKMAEVRSKMVDRVSDKLDLNEAQKVKLNVLADKLQAQRAAFTGKTPDPRAEMQAIVAGERFDRERAQALLNEKTSAVQANGPEVLGALADFYDALNPEQQQKVRDFMQRRKGWMMRG
jgi:Spy/CpxP family protein refolding chaperone